MTLTNCKFEANNASYLGSIAEQADANHASIDFPPSLHLSLSRAEESTRRRSSMGRSSSGKGGLVDIVSKGDPLSGCALCRGSRIDRN